MNVDKYPVFEPDVVHDLEVTPWPWEDDSVEETVLSHILEHLGQTTDVYRSIWQEIYRVSKNGAGVLIRVPHPRCDDYINDPTHVRPITPTQFTLFDQKFNEECAEKGYANSQLGKAWGINFQIVQVANTPTPLYLEKNPAKRDNAEWLAQQAQEKLNQIAETTILLRAVKP